MSKEWLKSMKKKLKPGAKTFHLSDVVYSQEYYGQYFKKPPPGYMEWDFEALNNQQQHYMAKELRDILKTNLEYLHYHPEVKALLNILIRSFAKLQPDNPRTHMKKVFKDPFLKLKIEKYLNSEGFKKTEKHLQHDEDVEREEEIDKEEYSGLKAHIECFRSELPVPEEIEQSFEAADWQEPYPDYMIKRYKTLHRTIPHYLKHTKQYYPMKPVF